MVYIELTGDLFDYWMPWLRFFEIVATEIEEFVGAWGLDWESIGLLMQGTYLTYHRPLKIDRPICFLVLLVIFACVPLQLAWLLIDDHISRPPFEIYGTITSFKQLPHFLLLHTYITGVKGWHLKWKERTPSLTLITPTFTFSWRGFILLFVVEWRFEHPLTNAWVGGYVKVIREGIWA
jgi:hypothetical protein